MRGIYELQYINGEPGKQEHEEKDIENYLEGGYSTLFLFVV